MTLPVPRRAGWPAILLALAAGCKSAPPPEEKAPPATVVWKEPAQVALEERLEIAGITLPLPDRVARVTAPVEGRVVSLLGDSPGSPIVEGQRVEKGAVLVQLDATIVQANLAKAEAAQDVLKEEERQARLAVDLATHEAERFRKLKREEDQQPPDKRRQLVSPVDLQKAEYGLKDAESKLKAATMRLAAGGKEQESLRAQLNLFTLKAPIAGRLGRIQVVRGQTLSVGAPVAEIVDLDEQIDVLCFVPPSMVGRLKVGQQAFSGGFDAGAAAGPEAEGQVEYIAEQAEPETGNFAVKIRFANNEAHLRSNRVLRIRIVTKPGRECLSVPEGAVQEDEEKPTVVIVEKVKTEKNADGKEETTGVARRLQVTLGVRDRTLHQIEIVGLEDPEKDPAKKWTGEVKDALFVVEGGQGLQTGDAVKLEVEGD
ncbi:MAG: efflux RND transporter periplasmic adaptor subunit [Gemmataceae bacterium]